MTFITTSGTLIPRRFKPPIVTNADRGEAAFHSYDWYFERMERHLRGITKVFLTPCAATKPIHTSSLHRSIYQKYGLAQSRLGREVFVVSEPVVLIRYQDLYDLGKYFCYDFPPKLLSRASRALFVERLRLLLAGKNVSGCLPRHHASLINDAVGNEWKNYWDGDLFSMMRKANAAFGPSRG